MMAIFRHSRSVRVHQQMATLARWGALGVLQRTNAGQGEYHEEDFDGSGCGNGHRRSGIGDVGHGGSAVAWRLARWMGLGSRPVHRRTCRRRPDRRCFGGAVCLPIPLWLLRRILRSATLCQPLRVAAGVERVRLGAGLRVTARTELFGPERAPALPMVTA